MKTVIPNNSSFVRYIDYVGVNLYNLLPFSIKLNNFKMCKSESKLYIFFETTKYRIKNIFNVQVISGI